MEPWPVPGMAATLLQRSWESGRLLHAYIFLGSEGCGQEETALHFAKMIFCQDRHHPPCGQCRECRRVASGNHPDLLQVAPQGQTLKIDQIRALQQSFSRKSLESSYKVYILHQAERMTTEAANALLKFLEEPASPVIAILLVQQKERLLPTILSRCQVIPFPPLPAALVQERLVAAGIPRETASLLAKIRATSAVEIGVAASPRFAELLHLMIQLSEDLAFAQGQPFLLVQEKIVKPGWTPEEVGVFLTLLAWWFRDLLCVKLGFTQDLVFTAQFERLQSQAALYQSERLERMIDTILLTKKRLQGHGNQQLALENMVLRLQGVQECVSSGRDPF